MANVSLQSIHKAYGTQAVVHDLNLEINDRDFIVRGRTVGRAASQRRCA